MTYTEAVEALKAATANQGAPAVESAAEAAMKDIEKATDALHAVVESIAKEYGKSAALVADILATSTTVQMALAAALDGTIPGEAFQRSLAHLFGKFAAQVANLTSLDLSTRLTIGMRILEESEKVA